MPTPTPNSAPYFSGGNPEAASVLDEHERRVLLGVYGALEALLKQYGKEVAAVYLAYLQSLASETVPAQVPAADDLEELAA